MIEYHVFCDNPHRHFIRFEGHFTSAGRDQVILQLPSWRPGRYELGNFAKNILEPFALNEKGERLACRKISKDAWMIHTEGASIIRWNYHYYASELNAGSSYLDTEQVYINPVNCFFYDAQHTKAPYRIAFHLPENYVIACGLKKESKHVLLAKEFDELADCPLIASATMRELKYESHGVPFSIVVQGDLPIDEAKWIKDFKAFSDLQIELFGDIPCESYTFLLQFTPYFVRHGVEHRNSTVIAMGPASEYIHANWYQELLAISCHELYHTWNIKNIRPIEMMPYDFTRENFSHAGYVAEGVTTYYGDLLLRRSQLIEDAAWLGMIEEAIQTHLDNEGRFRLSVADSSWDTWLDGYGAGIPWRKVSIYNEGCLIALMCDIAIMRATNNVRSLDDAMKKMYDDFGKKEIGYSSADYKACLEWAAGHSLDDIFNDHVFGTKDYLPRLIEALRYVGLGIVAQPSPKWSECYLGMSLDESAQKAVITAVSPHSPADQAGLWYGDEIMTVNGTGIYKNIQSLLKSNAETLSLGIIRKNKSMTIEVKASTTPVGMRFKVARIQEATEEEKKNYQAWIAPKRAGVTTA